MFIEIGSRLKILDPSPELIKWCKENLEMTNPEYQQKARMHLWLGNTPRTLYLYEVNGNSLILPFGCLRAILPLLEGDMKKQFKEPKKVDYGGKVPLYDYQEEAVAAMLINHYGILQSPAGSGKTQMGIALACALGVKTLWLTHTKDLLTQSKSRAEQYVDSELLGTITEGKVNIGKAMTFATIQTMCKLDLDQYRDEWDCVIVDECHRVSGTPTAVTQFSKVLNTLCARHKFGLSATVHRSDGMIKATYAMLGQVVWTVPDEAVKSRVMTVDSDVAEAVKKAALEEGIHIYTDAKVTSLSGMDSGHTMVAFEYESVTHTLAVETVLTATGRKPVTTGLGLKKAGVSLTDRGAVKTNDSMETNIHGIYAIGDLTGKLPLAHVASHQGIAAVDVICGKSRTIDYDAIPSVIFTHPEAACVGKTEKQCKELNIPFKVSTFPFAANGKAKIMGEAEGFVKLIRSEESGKILGGAIVGPDASALISTITAAVHTEMTDKDLIDMVFAHPTTSEAIYEAGLGLSIGPLHYQR